jgi:hypothetical protein
MKKIGVSIALVKTGDETNPWKFSILAVDEDDAKKASQRYSHHAEWDHPATGEKLYSHAVEAVSEFYVGETDIDAVFTPFIASLLNAESIKKAFETVVNQTISNIPWLATGKPHNGK